MSVNAPGSVPPAPASWPVRVAALIRRIIGAPDYASYVAHVRTHHPEREPLGEREFMAERWRERYEKPGGKCC
jgi:uncharacterized short protein YbdD (DUF466 family)